MAENDKLMAAIVEQIKEALPEQTAGALAEFVTKANAATIESEQLKKRNDKLESDNRRLSADLQTAKDQLAALTNDYSKLDAQRADIEERERNLKVTLAEARAEAAESKAEAIFNLAHGLVRNTEFRKYSFGTAPQNVAGSDNYNNAGGTVDVNTNETTGAD